MECLKKKNEWTCWKVPNKKINKHSNLPNISFHKVVILPSSLLPLYLVSFISISKSSKTLLLSQVFLVSLKASIQLSIKFYIKFYRRLTIVDFLLYTKVVIFTKDK